MSRFDGGIKWSGSSAGRSQPSSLTLIRCIAKANSSESKNPSLLMSESFQIFPSTLLGNLDLTISDLAAKQSYTKLYKLIFDPKKIVGRVQIIYQSLTSSRNLSVLWSERFKDAIVFISLLIDDPFRFACSCINPLSPFVSEWTNLIFYTFKRTTWRE